LEVAQGKRQADNAGMLNAEDRFQEWRLADHTAHAMEQQADATGEALTREIARQLRAMAEDLLRPVTADIKRRAAANR
jgi:flagellar biosynthesis/type III secretory pathway protein FliH